MEVVPAKLTKRLVDDMDGLIQQGWYANRSELIRDAVREVVRKSNAERLAAAMKEDVEWGLPVAGIKQAVFDTGPLIHLNEINASGLLQLFDSILLSPQVTQELGEGFPLQANCRPTQLTAGAKDYSKLVAAKFEIGLAEATAIALAKQEGCSLFFTDGLQAREASMNLGLQPHGTLAIITRAYSEKIASKEEALKFLGLLGAKSSLYITTDLLNWAKKRVLEHNNR